MTLSKTSIPFPTKGLVENTAYLEQPAQSTPRCFNVRPHGPATGRRTGGSRSGLNKAYSYQVNGSAAIQDINHIIGHDDLEFIETEDDLVIYSEDGFPLEVEYASDADAGQRNTTVVAVAGGTAVKLTAAAAVPVTNGTNILSNVSKTIFSVQHGLMMYYADGSNYRVYDAETNAIIEWVATAGTLPIDDGGNRATLAEIWHGRVVLAGLLNDKQNYFMSAVDDPYDYDYSPDAITSTMAVAGNLSTAGLVGDIITAMVPYSDDVLLFGGDHTIWRMNGDPADGGKLDLVSDVVGFAWGRAWCKSPEGVVYFFGSRGGVYRIDPVNGIPQRLTAMTIDERLAEVNLNDDLVRLIWDDRDIGVRVFITPKDGTTSTHYFWDTRTESWWADSFGNDDHQPLCVHLLDGYDPADRVVLLGGQDGYVRKCDVDATNDDGSAIRSSVFCGPVTYAMLAEMRCILSQQSGTVTWTIHNGHTLEEALDARPSANGRFHAGNNGSVWPRSYLDYGYLQLSSLARWELERLTVMVEPASENRSRLC